MFTEPYIQQKMWEHSCEQKSQKERQGGVHGRGQEASKDTRVLLDWCKRVCASPPHASSQKSGSQGLCRRETPSLSSLPSSISNLTPDRRGLVLKSLVLQGTESTLSSDLPIPHSLLGCPQGPLLSPASTISLDG